MIFFFIGEFYVIFEKLGDLWMGFVFYCGVFKYNVFFFILYFNN